MNKQTTSALNTKTLQSNKVSNWQAFGPGILLATAAIGGSHLISSTQAGAMFGWQLAIMIILANFFKYPFFKFGTDYVYDTGESLIAGYAKKSPIYLWGFFILSLAASVISTGAVALIAASILMFMLPESMQGYSSYIAFAVMGVSWLILILGHYKLLDRVTKWIMVALTFATLAAVAIAAGKPTVMTEGFIAPSPWNFETLAFIVALMGWMPAPLEFAAINSMWISAKVETDNTTHKQGLVDFNVGYISTSILALLFLALGVYVQYGSGVEIQTQGGKYIAQLINMYTATIGDWSKFLVAFVAFMVMFGTTITCADGYGRINAESWRLLQKDSKVSQKQLLFWITYTALGGFILITFFQGQLGALLKFAMISAFVSAPIFGLLNYSLIKSNKNLSTAMNVYSVTGLIFLGGIALLILAQLIGLLD